MYRVLFFGTHPKQFNGYSKVTYELVHEFAKSKDVELILFGFQNFFFNAKHRQDLPQNVQIYDAFKNNSEARGFGYKEITTCVRNVKPDVCIIFNDAIVVRNVMQELLKIPKEERTFKIVPYLDQVYLNQKKQFVNYFNEHADACILFTKYWENVFKWQGCSVPTFHLPHAFNSDHMPEMSKDKAREILGISKDDFVILNMNRNQPRKRWDVCIKAFVRVLQELYSNNSKDFHPVKLFIGTELQGSWNLLEIYERELKKCGLSFEVGKKHVMFVENPQRMSDMDINVIYNMSDVGINTCDGEGFGLCNFDHAGLGVPQIVPDLGGFKDFFQNGVNSTLIDPIISLYSTDDDVGLGGETLVTSYKDYADAIIDYYRSPELRQAHGQAAKKSITQNYKWSGVHDRLVHIVEQVMGGKKQPLPVKEPTFTRSSIVRTLA